LLAEYKEKMQILKDIEANKTAIEQNNKIDALLNVNSSNISVEKGIISDNDRIIHSNTTTIETNDKSIKVLQEKNLLNKQVISNYKFY
jgi:hypothetical protein